jgi:hypothetical protein
MKKKICSVFSKLKKRLLLSYIGLLGVLFFVLSCEKEDPKEPSPLMPMYGVPSGEYQSMDNENNLNESPGADSNMHFTNHKNQTQ